MKHPELLSSSARMAQARPPGHGRTATCCPSPFYNADSIAEGLGDANSTDLQTRARTLVDQEIAQRLKHHEPFGFESTWSGASRPAIVRDAANRGYETRAIFLGTADPRINIERVRRRVLEGGHHVPEHEIRRRWTRAFENLLETWDVFERIDVLDSSTENVHRVAGKHHGRIHTVATGLPRWARPIAIR